MDAVDRYLTASASNDIDTLIDTVTPDAELVSPVSGSMVFRGHEDLRIVLSAIYGSLAGVRWRDRLNTGHIAVVIGEARIGPLTLGDAMVLELADDGRIRRIKPHLRPWLSITVLALKLGPKIARHPKVVRRALQSRRSARRTN